MLEKIIVQVAIRHEKPKEDENPKQKASKSEVYKAINGRAWYQVRAMHKQATVMAKQARKLSQKL